MGRGSLAFLVVLLVALVAVSVVVNRDSIQGVANNADISLSADESQYILGQTVVFTGSLAFAEGETAAVSRVRLLNTQGPQALDLDLPVADTAGQFIDISTAVSGTLFVDISLNNVTSLGGTLPGGTLPGTFKIMLWGKNLADEEYTIISTAAWGFVGANDTSTFGEPRTYGLALSYDY